MFQASGLTGVFFLAGVAVAAPFVALGGALGALIGTLTAILFRFNVRETRDGIYGFNATLVGMALLANYQPALQTFLLIIAGAVVSTLLTFEMRRRVPIPTYTTPFIVTTWLALFLATRLNIAAVATHPLSPPGPLNVTSAVVAGISEVMFEANLLTGVLFLVGILLCSWRAAVWALTGSLLGLLAAVFHQSPESNIALGIYGYNAALAAMAMALNRPGVILPIFAAILSFPITDKFPALGLATLTAPFVLACWIVIGLDMLDSRFRRVAANPLNAPGCE